MALKKKIAFVLNAIRISRGLSITAFAQELEIGRSTLEELLNGTANPTLDTLQHIADKLQIDPLALFSISGTKAQALLFQILVQMIDNTIPLSKEHQEEFAMHVQGILALLEK